MEIQWISQTWFDLLQSAGIIGGLWYTARSFRFHANVRRTANLNEVIDGHRKIWSQIYDHPELARIRKIDPDLKSKPITIEEEQFVTQIIHHLRGVHFAEAAGVIEPIHGIDNDVRTFFSKPIPAEIWERKKEFQSSEFVDFFESVVNKSVTNDNGNKLKGYPRIR